MEVGGSCNEKELPKSSRPVVRSLWDRPTRPHRSPTAIPSAVVSKRRYLLQHYQDHATRTAFLLSDAEARTDG